MENLVSRGFNPDIFVYYSNDTKSTDNICIYQGNDLIYYNRTAYNHAPIQTISEKIESGESAAAPESSDPEKIILHIGITPGRSMEQGTAEYEAYLFWENENFNSKRGEFNNAVISVNDITMSKISDDFFRINKGDGLVLSTGDPVIVIVEHELTGYIRKKLIVPPSMDDFTIEPPLQAGVPNTRESYLMRWEEQECDIYAIELFRADDNGELNSYGSNEKGPFYLWDFFHLRENNKVVPYLEFSIMPANRAEIKHLSEFSTIYVTAPERALYGNYHGENR